jgi:diguanylate cyclase (GGDEF)-like protein/PAS domain S-box-containing protein
MHSACNEFAGNVAFVGLAIAIWAHLSTWFARRLMARARQAFGLAMGLTAIGSMLLAARVAPGILIDIRHAPLALAAMFGGPAAAVIAGALVASVRIWIGGAGVTDGLVTIGLVLAFGLALHAATQKRQPRVTDILALTAGVVGLLTITSLYLPLLTAHDTFHRAGPELISLNAAACLLGGLILLMTRRSQLERSILEHAFAQSPDFIYVKDRNSRFLIVNDNMATLYRRSGPAALTGRTDFDVMPRHLAEQLFGAEQEMMRSGVPIIDSFENIDDRFLLASKVPIRDAEGRVIGLAGVTRDITERTGLENELRESKNLLAHAMASMSDGFAIFDRAGTLVFCNEQYRTYFPLSAHLRHPGRHITEILHCAAHSGERTDCPPEGMNEWVRDAARALHCNKDEEVELSTGSWVSIRTRLAEDGSAMVVVSDITSTKMAERALRLAAEQLKNLAETDGLTGVVNRRAFDEIFAREAARSAREGTDLSLLMIDIDWFKAFNDTYGHPSGDDCLKRVSACLVDCARRPADCVARYGGEEFVLLLPNTDRHGATKLAQQVMDRLRGLGISHSGSPFGYVTASVGAATGNGRGLRADHERLLAAADGALYQAKAAGRNRMAEGAYIPRDADSLAS